MGRHTFNFIGGDELTTMGAGWFVSYYYYSAINPSHKNWSRVSTSSNRRSVYMRTMEYHKIWLEEVLKMDSGNLNRNTIGLSGNEIKKMALELLGRG